MNGTVHFANISANIPPSNAVTKCPATFGTNCRKQFHLQAIPSDFDELRMTQRNP